MKQDIIKSLSDLKKGLVVIGNEKDSQKDYIFIVMAIHHEKKTKTTKLGFVEINKSFTTWDITFPTNPNEKSEFISKNNSDFNFVFFNTKYVAEELYQVLLNHMTPEE